MSDEGGAAEDGATTAEDGATTAGAGAPLIAVVDYGIGNLRSAQKALQRAGADARLTADPVLIADAAAVALPGVGHFGTAMGRLRALGLDEAVLAAVESGRPFLGICVGMQMLFDSSEEAPGVAGLGVLPGAARLLPDGLPRPQMQWNPLRFTPGSCPLLDGLDDGAWMYFVHSYAVRTDDELVVATCDYPDAVTALVQRGPLWATQFHPE
ncbi:imidazole glycerol phosphate synthase subunit HisH, partial [Microbacterium maritypicum]|uniref:imidazole glycerol phosphate synthase subunit HisH n=1 Tax=Microbacterium maritypicum TaxID=33918 RepID=UPI00296F0BE5